MNRKLPTRLQDTEGVYNDILDKVSEQVARVPESSQGHDMRWVLVMRSDGGGANILTHGVDVEQTVQLLKDVIKYLPESPQMPVGGRVQ